MNKDSEKNHLAFYLDKKGVKRCITDETNFKQQDL